MALEYQCGIIAGRGLGDAASAFTRRNRHLLGASYEIITPDRQPHLRDDNWCVAMIDVEHKRGSETAGIAWAGIVGDRIVVFANELMYVVPLADNAPILTYKSLCFSKRLAKDRYLSILGDILCVCISTSDDGVFDHENVVHLHFSLKRPAGSKKCNNGGGVVVQHGECSICKSKPPINNFEQPAFRVLSCEFNSSASSNTCSSFRLLVKAPSYFTKEAAKVRGIPALGEAQLYITCFEDGAVNVDQDIEVVSKRQYILPKATYAVSEGYDLDILNGFKGTDIEDDDDILLISSEGNSPFLISN